MENNMQLSIIVPVYNVAPYLRDCIESLLDQGFSEDEYEIIIVDDGSTDSSLKIIQNYAQMHRCIKYIHQDNAGVSAARNTGLDYAIGKYIAFVDGDDFLVTQVLKKLCDEARMQDADTLMWGYAMVEENSSFMVSEKCSLLISPNTDGVVKSSSHVCSTLFKSEIIEDNRLRFPDGLKYGEDTFFAGMVSMFVRADKQFFCNKRIYFYRQRSGSAMHTHTDESIAQHMNDMLCEIDLWSEFLRDHPELSCYNKNNIQQRKYLMAAAALFDALRSKTVNEHEVRRYLQDKRVYPYPFMLYIITRKINMPNLIMLLLKYRFVFELLSKTGVLKGK